jgi:exodeoxyribonuclease VII small subunit
MPRRPSTDTPEPSADTPTFEEALASLQAIVEAMEHENLPLADLVSQYEKGSALLARCEAILQTARGRIELITLRNQAEIGLEVSAQPAEVRPPSSMTATADDTDDDANDIRLF